MPQNQSVSENKSEPTGQNVPENQNPATPEAFAEAVRRLEALTRAFAEEIGRAADQAVLDTPVPTCPGWEIRDLIDHLAGIHRWAAAALHAEHAPAELPRPPGTNPVDWYRAGAEHLAGQLRAAGPDAPAWTLWGDRAAAFWARRQVHETALHTFDLLDALGRAEEWEVDDDLALDGIREILFGFYPRQVRLGRSRGLPGVVRVEVTHDGGRPAAVLTPPAVGEGSDRGLGVVTGSARAVYLGLWGRRPLPGTDAELARTLRDARLAP